jgi:very-short-patch-repair endonuclease
LLGGLVILILVVGATLMKLLRPNDSTSEPVRFPFEVMRPLTDREQVLYWRLRKVLPEQMVLAQVALSRIVRVEKGYDFRAWLNRINRMTVDFLVCLPDATIVAAIELDDASHAPSDRVAADAKKDKALESAGIKLLRFRDIPTEDELRHAFLG